MRRVTKVAFQVRDFMGHRLSIVRAGGSPEPYVDLAAQCVLLAGLVEVGLLFDDDWAMSQVPFSSRGASLDGYRAVMERRVLDRLGRLESSLKKLDFYILSNYVPVIADLAVEMAHLCFYRETMLSAVMAAARRRQRAHRRRGHHPVELLDRSALHADPKGFLEDAQARLAQAKEDIVKAKRRIQYLGNERPAEKPEPPRQLPPAVSMDTPAILSLVSAIRGATDDLLHPVEVARPDPAKRRR